MEKREELREREEYLRWAEENWKEFAGPLPGGVVFPEALAKQLAFSYREKGPDYRPRTHHFKKNGLPKYTNRLIMELSPYLQQHAHNPVNWYPWGEEAFQRARREGKPILLSVGYSTCHWCHVMERESFENEEIAEFLNQHYIAVKVDREERPDVDALYMEAVQLFTRGGGGWPMTVWLTPDKKPFFAGTYFPPRQKWGRPGFLELLKIMHHRYTQNPEKFEAIADDVVELIRGTGNSTPSKDLPQKSVLKAAYQSFSQLYDPVHGGMRGAPKFPSSFGNAFLLRYYRKTGEKKALEMVEHTLKKMAFGGIYDQVGGGFHRYSTDERWLVPHFEKMLYDNALLASLYSEAYQLTKKPLYARIARETYDYILREMTSPAGGFYSATDADSEGEEGKFFVWSYEELRKVLSKDLFKVVQKYYGVSKGGNFEGKNILYIPKEPEEVARELGLTTSQLAEKVEEIKKTLYNIREKRVHPLRDDKIIAAWNGLMIASLARGGFILKSEKYIDAAERAGQFIWSNLVVGDRLHRIYKDGTARHGAALDDYAFVISGFIELFEVTGREEWLERAIQLQKTQDKYYWDDKSGGYFRTPSDGEKLLVRQKPAYDGAVPSGNSAAALNLLRLYYLTQREEYLRRAEELFKFFKERLENSPLALSEMLLALGFYWDRVKEIAIVWDGKFDRFGTLVDELRSNFVPNRVFVIAREGEIAEKLSKLIPWLEDKKAGKFGATVYICYRGNCELPTSDPEKVRELLKK